MKWVILLSLLSACGNEVNTPPEPTPTPEPEVGSPSAQDPAGVEPAKTGEKTVTVNQVVEPSPDPEPVVGADDGVFDEWVATRNWLIVGPGDAVDAVCDEGYKIPNIYELEYAASSGLADEFVERGLDTRIWVANFSDGEVESWWHITDTTVGMETLVDGFVLCVEE